MMSDDAFEVLQAISQVRNLLMKRLSKPRFEDIPGLTLREAYILHSLPEGRMVKISDIAQSHAISPSTLTGLLDRLEERGFIVRHRDVEDRRAVLIERRPHLPAEEAWHHRMEEELLEIFKSMAPSDVEHLRAGLAALVTVLTEGASQE